MKTEKIIEARRKRLEKLVRCHGFYTVVDQTKLKPSTLGEYLDDSNEKCIAENTLELCEIKLAG